MDYLEVIKQPIKAELDEFIALFNSTLSHEDGLLSQALDHIRQRSGKRMRPMLILLVARNFGEISSVTQYAATGLELLHTASLVHDDVVDESQERRGQPSVNASYDNKVAVLVGDFILSTALLNIAKTRNDTIVRYLAELGRTLSSGEILQLNNISRDDFSEEVYYEVISQKTAALFESCAAIGALSANASEEEIKAAEKFGKNLGLIFQIRDDIFDYEASSHIGKPTGNDMREGKLTLPVLYALNTTHDESMRALALKVKDGSVTDDEIEVLIRFAKDNGGMMYAEDAMRRLQDEAASFLRQYVKSDEIRRSLTAYLDYVAKREI